MIHLRVIENSIHMFIPANNSLAERVREIIPGATWNSVERYWVFPLTRRCALRLRDFLRGQQVKFAGNHDASLLTKTADSPPVPDLVINSEDASEVKLSIEFHVDYQNFAQRHQGNPIESGAWSFPISVVPDLLFDIERSGLDIVVANDVRKLGVRQWKPLNGYDGTLLSLRNIPLRELRVAAEKDARVKKGKRKVKTFSENLQSMGIENLFDLINHVPLRYVDRSQPSTVDMMVEGEEATLIGKIVSLAPYNPAKRMTKMTVEDAIGKKISVVFFNQRYINFVYRVGNVVILHGKTTLWKGRFKSLASPTIDHLNTQSGSRPVIPIYSQSEKHRITTWDLLNLNDELFSRMVVTKDLSDTLPQELITKYSLTSRRDAFRSIHFPNNMEEVNDARRRIIYEELLQLQLHIQTKKKSYTTLTGIAHTPSGAALVEQYTQSLPYPLTGAQAGARDAILGDMGASQPMHRLLQGDVGSGKSHCGAMTVLNAVGSGYQAALMAPTEILAEQLYNGLVEELEVLHKPGTGEPIIVEFLGGKTTKKNKETILEKIKTQEIDILVGTHALISDGVEFSNLGAIVIDEQHRFGTRQRTKLRTQRTDGRIPDMLVMTATPIPRTGALVAYGDLDITVLDELPPGRAPIKTTWVQESGMSVAGALTHPVWDHVLAEVNKGHQGYVVASLVEDNEKLAAQSTEDALLSLSMGALKGIRLGMVHGRMARKEREETMNAFAAGDIDVLVSTTVIEVGVNVPNSTIMVILDAGKFGIAQLHQIRGRVGRSSFPSTCYLISDTETPEGTERLTALAASTDGFYLAEKDLEIRGEGTLFGEQQSGESDLRVASLRDMSALLAAREDAINIVEHNPELGGLEEFKLEVDTFFGSKEIQS